MPDRPDRPIDLEAVAKRLDRQFVIGQESTDGLLEHVALIGRLGAAVGIGLLVDGVMLLGAVTPHLRFAESVSEATRAALQNLDWPDESLEEVVGAFVEVENHVAERADSDRSVLEKYSMDSTLDDVEMKDAFEFLRALRDRTILDLQDVSMYYDGNPEAIRLSVMRVHMEKISAWWPLTAQGIEVTYTSPQAIEPS